MILTILKNIASTILAEEGKKLRCATAPHGNFTAHSRYSIARESPCR
jgi:hypothetical protein